MKERVYDLIRKELGVTEFDDATRIHPTLTEDSLEITSLMIAVEVEFDIDIDVDEEPLTVGEMVAYVEKRVAA